MTWRDDFRPIIARVLSENAGLDERQLRKSLREAFPAGPRKYHPYKIWLDEINVQLGTKKQHLSTVGEPRPIPSLPGQLDLFGE